MSGTSADAPSLGMDSVPRADTIASATASPQRFSRSNEFMSYVYAKVDDLDGTDKVGSHQCVALVQHYAKVPPTGSWTEGDAVLGNLKVVKGTAIATFVDGKYKSLPSGNHAAFLVSQDAKGLWIMDQWNNDKVKPKVSKRYVTRKGKDAKGNFIDASNNVDAYAVIE
jgi:hypothetical protein